MEFLRIVSAVPRSVLRTGDVGAPGRWGRVARRLRNPQRARHLVAETIVACLLAAVISTGESAATGTSTPANGHLVEREL